jgi:hypothetical protein
MSRGSSSTSGIPSMAAMVFAVVMARPSGLETMRQPDASRIRSFSRRPTAWAWRTPSSVSGESTWPCSRRSRLNSVWPWRTR